jgi:hypothetical protein
MRVAFAAGLLSYLAGAAAAQTAPKPAVTTREITATDLRRRLYLLADDSMGGREPGTIGNFKATEYVASEFKRLGLKPAGEHGSYFQSVPFVRERTDPGRTLEVEDGVTLSAGRDFLPALWIASRAEPRLNARAVYGGNAADAHTWIDTGTVRGRLVVLDVKPVQGASRQWVRTGVTARSARWQGAAALAFAQLDLIDPALRRQVTEGQLVADAGSGAQPPVVILTPDAAQSLFRAPLAGLGPGTTGKPVRGNLGLARATPTYPARNVIAILPGTDSRLRREYLSLSAHNDHVGFGHDPVDHDSLRAFNRVVRPAGADSPVRAATVEETARIRGILDSLRALRPPRPDSIRNGADDDGSGTVALLELAESFARSAARPRRSLLFVSHTGEEYGLAGSAWYTDHPTVPRDSIVAEIDQDMIGRGDKTDLPAGGPTYLEVVGARRLSNEFGDLLEAANAAQPLPFVFNYEYDVPGHPLQYYCRADHYNYARYGIPSVSLSRGEHLDYHQVTDEPQYIDYDALARVTRMVREAALRVGNADRRPALDHPKGDPRAPCVQ